MDKIESNHAEIEQIDNTRNLFDFIMYFLNIYKLVLPNIIFVKKIIKRFAEVLTGSGKHS